MPRKTLGRRSRKSKTSKKSKKNMRSMKRKNMRGGDSCYLLKDFLKNNKQNYGADANNMDYNQLRLIATNYYSGTDTYSSLGARFSMLNRDCKAFLS